MKLAVRVLCLICLLTLHCSRDYPLFEKSHGRFPLSVGNEWWLSEEWKVESSPGSRPGLENLWSRRCSIHWTIAGRETLAGHRSYVMKKELHYEEDNVKGYLLDWYTDSWGVSQGLYHIGTIGGGRHPAKLPYRHRLKFAGEAFGSFQEIFDWVSGHGLLKQDPTIRIPPRRVLEYPLEVGKEWIAFDDGWLQTRKVVDTEPITTKAGTFFCSKIKVIGEIWKDSMVWYDWFSDEGLVKRYIWATGEYTGPWGNPDGTWVLTDVYLLEDYSITE